MARRLSNFKGTIREYQDSDFEQVATLLKNMYDHIWIDLFHWKGTSLGDAREAVKTDCLAPDTKTLVAIHGPERRLVGFLSFAIRHGGVYFIEYIWVEKAYKRLGYEEKLLRKVEEHARQHGQDCIHVRLNANEHDAVEFFLSQGYNVLKGLETAKYFIEPTYISGELVEIAVHRFKTR